jgi:hypothetical protein
LFGEFGNAYPLPTLEPLWNAAQALNLGGVPAWPGEPQTGPDAFAALDALACWCRLQIARSSAVLVQVPPPTNLEDGGRAENLPEPTTQERLHPDGPEGGRWIWWQNKRYDVPKGNVYRIIAYMWNRDSASYDELENATVFESSVAPQTVRSYANKVNNALPPGIPWRLSANSTNRQLTKVSTAEG